MTAGAWLHATIGPYRLVEFVGAGGMGEVYRAVDSRGGRVVAVKVLTSARRVPSLLERFRNEARIHAALHHPHIAQMHEFLDEAGAPCIVMEFVDGETLDQRLHRRGAMPLMEALALAAPVVDAVGHMHERGIIHRDIKSTNVKVSATGVIKLLDFGIAKGPGSPALTADGSVIGTLQALAPEQLEGAPADRRSDIWSLGIVIYELVTGQHPFAAGGADGITARIRAGRYAPPSRVVDGLPGTIDRIVSRCLRVDPRDRYKSCEALMTDIRALIEPPPLLALPVRGRITGDVLLRARSHAPLVGAMTAAAAAVVFLVVSISKPAPPPESPEMPWVLQGSTVPVAPPVSPAADTSGDSTVHTVTVNTMDGSAEVWQDGRMVGRTPYRVSAAIGDEVSLVLRQPGYQDQPVRFDVTERTEYSVVMRPAPPRGPSSSLPWPAALLGFAWFSLPWKRRAPSGSSALLTVERPMLVEGGNAAESRVVVGVATDPGCVRDSNEDTVRVVRPSEEVIARDGLLAMVCDGMGGHAAGETASRIAADVIARDYAGGGDPGESLARAVQHANRAIYDAARADPALMGMGTTCTAIVLRGGLAWCAHVGDSRCYLVREREIFLMTEDHSAVMAMVRDGALSRDEARHHPDKNVISRALGSHREVEVTSWPRPFVVRPGDRFLLCSDGLYDVATDEEVRDVIRDAAPHDGCAGLVALARERGAPDNVSVVMLAIPEGETAGAPGATRAMPVAS